MKKGFTLVELLAVIVILAVILVIAVPQINKLIKQTRANSLGATAKLLASKAEEKEVENDALGLANVVLCKDLVKLDDNYGKCTVRKENGQWTVKLKGAGKFEGYSCTGTKGNMTCGEIELLPGYAYAVELIEEKYNDGDNSDGLVKVEHDTTLIPNATPVEYRYQGTSVKNYVRFNCEDYSNPTAATCEVWRIVGLFDGRLKLMRYSSIGTYAWDSSDISVINGWGVNQWGESGSYEGSDMMRMLNDYYYNGVTDGTCYTGGSNTSVSCSFPGLTEGTKDLIDDAIWYLGGTRTATALEDRYADERGTLTCQKDNEIGCGVPNDGVARTTIWVGKVGLLYPSDFGYASSNPDCKDSVVTSGNCNQNWISNGGRAWTISPGTYGADAPMRVYWFASNSIGGETASYTEQTRPAVYLIPDVQMKGSGTSSDPYVLSE